jgi:hypothetical protein
MEKPTPAQFGLTEWDLKENKRRLWKIRQTGKRITIGCILISVVASIIYLNLNLQFDLFGFLFFVYFIGVVGGVIIGRVAVWLLDILRARNPHHKKVLLYQKAKEEYESRLAGTR